MFCQSIHHRLEWCATPALLSKDPFYLKETKLETHDIALPIHADTDLFRIKLLSSKDAVNTAGTLAVIERLVHIDASPIGVIFLLRGHDVAEKMRGLADFQVLMFNHFEIPVFPIADAPDIVTVLESIQKRHEIRYPLQPSSQAARNISAHLASGRPLSGTQSDQLADMFSRLGQLG